MPIIIHLIKILYNLVNGLSTQEKQKSVSIDSGNRNILSALQK